MSQSCMSVWPKKVHQILRHWHMRQKRCVNWKQTTHKQHTNTYNTHNTHNCYTVLKSFPLNILRTSSLNSSCVNVSSELGNTNCCEHVFAAMKSLLSQYTVIDCGFILTVPVQYFRKYSRSATMYQDYSFHYKVITQ